MAGLGIRLYTDEMIDPLLALTLRQRGYDVQSCRDARRHSRRISDSSHLQYAAQQGRAVLTLDVVDYLVLEGRWKTEGFEHAGIVLVSKEMTIGHLLRCVQRHLDTVEPATQLWLETSAES